MSRKRSRYKRRNLVNFSIRPVHLVFAFLLIGVAVFLLNPSPSEFRLENIYRKVAHTISHEKSEYVTDEYVADILSQDGTYKNQNGEITAVFENSPVAKVLESPSSRFLTSVLPANIEEHILAAVDDARWVEIDLSDQKLYAWESGNKVFDFTVSSGKPWTPTVTGDFRIWIKLRQANMKGGSKERGDYYFLPNVPFVMYFHKGYGIHGTYWHNNFGQVMSHGCVNLRTEDAGELFEWVGPYLNGKSTAKSVPENPGTRVVVHD